MHKDGKEIEAAIKSNHVVTEAAGRMAEHLAQNSVGPGKDKATRGLALSMDGKAERFTGSDEANALLTRIYREPYVVPENV